MIYDVTNSRHLALVDSKGLQIPYAYEFNDETCEVKFYLTGDQNGKRRPVVSGESYFAGYELVRCSAIVKGAKMVPREKTNAPDSRTTKGR